MAERYVAPVMGQPGWLLDLVAAVDHYEDVHPKVEDGDECFGKVLKAVPSEVVHEARGYARAKREAAANFDLGNPLGWSPEQIQRAEERSAELDKLIDRSADG